MSSPAPVPPYFWPLFCLAAGVVLVSPDAQWVTSSSAQSRTWRRWILGAELRAAFEQLERSSPGPVGGGSWLAQLPRLARARQPVHGGGRYRVAQPLCTALSVVHVAGGGRPGCRKLAMECSWFPLPSCGDNKIRWRIALCFRPLIDG